MTPKNIFCLPLAVNSPLANTAQADLLDPKCGVKSQGLFFLSVFMTFIFIIMAYTMKAAIMSHKEEAYRMEMGS